MAKNDYLEFSATLIQHEKLSKSMPVLIQPVKNIKMKFKLVDLEAQVWLLCNHIVRSAFVIPFKDIEYVSYSGLNVSLGYRKANKNFILKFLISKETYRDQFLDQIMSIEETSRIVLTSIDDIDSENLNRDSILDDSFEDSSDDQESRYENQRSTFTQTVKTPYGTPSFCEENRRKHAKTRLPTSNRVKVEIVYDLDKNFQRYKYEKFFNEKNEIEHRRTLVN